jgi:Tfp pilus assembly protein PilF
MDARRRVAMSLLAVTVVIGCAERTTTAPAATTSASTSTPLPAAASASAPKIVAAKAKTKPKSDPSLDVTKRRAYVKTLEEARALHRKKDFKGAVKAFQKALELMPDDARALSELGWSAFNAKDLGLAEASLKKALARTTDPELRGSTLYNLGRVHEEEGDKPRAIADYQASLRARANAVVLARLATLDPGTAQSFAILTPAKALGPFADLPTACAALTQAIRATDPATNVSCDPDATAGSFFEGAVEAADVGTPWLSARIITTCADTVTTCSTGEVHLAMQTKIDGKWWVAPHVESAYNPGAFGIYEGIAGEKIEVLDRIVGGAPEVVLQLRHERTDSDLGWNEVESYTTESMLLCGIGPSNEPSCTRPIPLAHHGRRSVLAPENDEAGAKHPTLFDDRWDLRVSFLDGGPVELAKGTGKIPDDLEAILGMHTVTWP